MVPLVFTLQTLNFNPKFALRKFHEHKKSTDEDLRNVSNKM